MEKVKAEKIFLDTKTRVENAVKLYSFLKSKYPTNGFPLLARRIWREGMQAEIWGTIATKLSKKKINYLDEWRQGR